MKNKQQRMPQYIITPREVSNKILEVTYPELDWIEQRLPDNQRIRQQKVAVLLYGNKNKK